MKPLLLLCFLLLMIFACHKVGDEEIEIGNRFLDCVQKNSIKELKSMISSDIEIDTEILTDDIKKVQTLLYQNKIKPQWKFEKNNAHWMTSKIYCSLGKLPQGLVSYTLELNFRKEGNRLVLIGYILDRDLVISLLNEHIRVRNHCCPIKNCLKPMKPFTVAVSAPSPRGEGWGEAINSTSNTY